MECGKELFVTLKDVEISDKVLYQMSISICYKERFKAEYWQTKIRYEKLKSFNNKIIAADMSKYTGSNIVPMPKHDCPVEMLKRQQEVMGEYLGILEHRAIIEDIDLYDIAVCITYNPETTKAE